MDDTIDTGEPAGLARSGREMSAPELVRRITHILATAADKAGVQYPRSGCFHPVDLAHEILLAVRSGRGIPPAEYRRVFRIWSIFGGRAHA